MKRKGLSQILYLIIAASVLMMAALTVIFAFNQGVLGIGADTQKQICTSRLDRQCQGLSGETITVNVPDSCTKSTAAERVLRSGIGSTYQMRNPNSNDAIRAGDPVPQDGEVEVTCP